MCLRWRNGRGPASYYLSKSSQLRNRQNHAVQYLRFGNLPNLSFGFPWKMAKELTATHIHTNPNCDPQKLVLSVQKKLVKNVRLRQFQRNPSWSEISSSSRPAADWSEEASKLITPSSQLQLIKKKLAADQRFGLNWSCWEASVRPVEDLPDPGTPERNTIWH